MESISNRIARVNQEYGKPETIDERIKRVNREYEIEMSEDEVNDWFSSSRSALNTAND